MTVVLLLLIFVMRQAAEPRIYEVFFGVEPESEAEPVGDLSDSFDAALATTQQQRVRDLPVTDPCRRFAAILTQAMPISEQQQWTTVLVRWNAGKPFPLMRSLVDQTVQLLADLAEADEQERAIWKTTLEKFGKIYGDAALIAGNGQPEAPVVEQDGVDQPTELSDQEALRLGTWLAALDAAALDRVVDGVWRSADFDAFYLQLEQADDLRASGAVTTSVVALLQQPEIYRGQLVRVSGLIAKADRMDASANPHGIERYWQLWIKPDTGGDRPIVLIVHRLPESIEDAINQGGHPRAYLVGRFFKRLAYRSQLGADLAPVVIGRLAMPRPAVKPAASPAPASSTASNKHRFLITLLFASVIGVSLAAIAMWRTSVAAKRSRQLRAQRQHPGDIFDDLAQVDLKHEDETEGKEQH